MNRLQNWWYYCGYDEEKDPNFSHIYTGDYCHPYDDKEYVQQLREEEYARQEQQAKEIEAFYNEQDELRREWNGF